MYRKESKTVHGTKNNAKISLKLDPLSKNAAPYSNKNNQDFKISMKLMALVDGYMEFSAVYCILLYAGNLKKHWSPWGNHTW